MTQAQIATPPGVRGVHVGDDAAGLAQLRAPDCAAAIWHRDLPAGFTDWINALAPAALPSTRTVLRPEDVADAASHLCNIAGLDDGPERDWLVEDIAALSERFAAMMNAPYLRLRLDVVNTNACRRFHRDAIMARLICTYRGTGTQYGTARDNADPDPVQTVKTGNPMVMRGSRWPETPDTALLHRSPPIEGSGETRMVLVLDPIFDPEDA